MFCRQKKKLEELFKFSWTIENVTVWDYYRPIVSPRFVVKDLGNAAFVLKWNEKGKSPGNCSLHLRRKKCDGAPNEVKFPYSLKVSKAPTKHATYQEYAFKNRGVSGYSDYVANHLILKKDDWNLLSGQIRIECAVCKPEVGLDHLVVEVPEAHGGFTEYSGLTRFKTETLSVKWKIKHFSTLHSGDKVATEIFLSAEQSPRFLATLYLTDKSPECEMVQMNIINLGKPQKKPTFVACKMTFGEKKGAKFVKIDKHVFAANNANSHWELPVFIRKCELVSENKNGPLDDVMPILLEFKLEDGLEISRIEKAAFELVCCSQKPAVKRSPSISSQSGKTKEYFLKLLREQKLCDVRLETLTHTIGAHKAIICGNSPVFAAMLEQDMAEKETKTIHVPDISFETLERFLECLYTECLDPEVGVQQVFELYFPADYYQVGFLKTECSDFLKKNLQVWNVCEVLLFADRHQDRELMDSVRNFIAKSKQEVLVSREWKSLLDANLKVAFEALQSVLRSN